MFLRDKIYPIYSIPYRVEVSLSPLSLVLPRWVPSGVKSTFREIMGASPHSNCFELLWAKWILQGIHTRRVWTWYLPWWMVVYSHRCCWPLRPFCWVNGDLCSLAQYLAGGSQSTHSTVLRMPWGTSATVFHCGLTTLSVRGARSIDDNIIFVVDCNPFVIWWYITTKQTIVGTYFPMPSNNWLICATGALQVSPFPCGFIYLYPQLVVYGCRTPTSTQYAQVRWAKVSR